jgi:hypothetical protein
VVGPALPWPGLWRPPCRAPPPCGFFARQYYPDGIEADVAAVARLAAMASHPPEAESRTDAELVRLREENLRLRDLLIARDAELGAAKGQVAALEAGTARLLNLVGRIRSMVPGIVWLALARLRGRGPQG